MPQKFKVLRRDRAATTIPEDVDHVFDHTGHDYGLASDDSRLTGIEHRSVTLKEDGSHPFFTIPIEDLEKVDG